MARYNNNVLFQLPFLSSYGLMEDAVLAAATGRQAIQNPRTKRGCMRADDERYRPLQANTDQSFRSLRPPKKKCAIYKTINSPYLQVGAS